MNRYNPKIHHRRSIRLKGYDYSQAGLYFVTICVKNRKYLFGKIVNGNLILNDAGRMVNDEWLKLPERFQNIRLHQYIIMPNHFHAILEIVEGATLAVALAVAPDSTVTQYKTNNSIKGQQKIAPTEKGQQKIAKKKTLGDMVGAFESITTVKYIHGIKNNGWRPFDGKLWQRNYWESIIRDEKSFQTISAYIINNPLKWNNDKFK